MGIVTWPFDVILIVTLLLILTSNILTLISKKVNPDITGGRNAFLTGAIHGVKNHYATTG
jgi:hypothetical protein